MIIKARYIYYIYGIYGGKMSPDSVGPLHCEHYVSLAYNSQWEAIVVRVHTTFAADGTTTAETAIIWTDGKEVAGVAD